MRWDAINDLTASAVGADAGMLYVLDAVGAAITVVSEAEASEAGAVSWDGAVTLAARDGSLYVADRRGRVWVTPTGDVLDPAAASLVTTLGAPARAMAVDANGVLLALVARPRVTVPLRPDPLRPGFPTGSVLRSLPVSGRVAALRHELLWIDRSSGAMTTVAAVAPSNGLAVSDDGGRAYLTTSGGALISVDIATGDVSTVTTGLAAPGGCTWVEAGVVLAVAESGHGRVALVDVGTGEVRRVLGAPDGVATLAMTATSLIVGSAAGLSSLARLEADLRRVHVHDPADALPRGGYSRLLIDVGLSGLDSASLDLTVDGGPEFGMFSASVEHPPRPDAAVLIAGPHPGSYTITARSGPGGPIVASAAFDIVDRWAGPDGPSQAFTGRCEIFTSGAAGWGSLWNNVFPWSFTYGVQPAAGTRRVAIILADPTGFASPMSDVTPFSDALVDGVTWEGTTASAAGFYGEMSSGALAIQSAGVAQVSLGHGWGEYFDAKAHPADGSQIFVYRHELIADAVWEAAKQLDLTTVDTLVVVVPSPNGGMPIPPPPPLTDPVSLFAWPVASGGTYMWGQWGPFPTIYQWSWKPFRLIVMPVEWEALRSGSDSVLTTLTHEFGHTIGMPDLYLTKVRDVTNLDVMSDESDLPALSLPQRVALGWTPRSQLKRYNFLLTGSADEDVTITAAELTAGGPRNGEFSGIEIEIEDGRRYYFEYRSEQDLTPPDTGPLQIADRRLGLRNERIIGYDVAAGSYAPPIDRGPVILLTPDADDARPGVFGVGDDYEELDAAGNSTFKLTVISTSDESAVVHVKYGPTVVPTPSLDGSDPSLRPWPGNGVWVSPDLTITNPMSKAFGFPAIQNGVTNTVLATVHNDTDVDAKGVTVHFWVKDFTVSQNGPEFPLGRSGPLNVPAHATTTFALPWPVPNGQPIGVPGVPYVTHKCLVARIDPVVDTNGVLLERTTANNEAQTNITIGFASFASPGIRTSIPIAVTNPFVDRPVTAHLHIDQDQDGWRTYIEHLSVHLEPGQTRTVEVMTECLFDQPGHPDLPNAVRTTPVVLSAVSYLLEDGDAPEVIGGATIEVRPGRAVTIDSLDVSRTNAAGRVVDVATGTAVGVGSVLVTARAADGAEASFIDRVSGNGTFHVATPDLARFMAPIDLTLTYSDGDASVASVRMSIT